MQYDQRKFDTNIPSASASGYANEAGSLTTSSTVPQSPMGKACDSFSGRMEQLEVVTSELERKFGPLLRAIPPSPESASGAKDGNISSVTAMVHQWDSRATEVLRRLSQLMDRCDL